MFLYDSVPFLFEPTFDVLFRSNCFLTMLCFLSLLPHVHYDRRLTLMFILCLRRMYL